MENKSQDRSIELSAQELAEIAGGAYLSNEGADLKNTVHNATETVAKQIDQAKQQYWSDHQPINSLDESSHADSNKNNSLS